MELKSHWGILVKRWVYAIGIAGAGVGMGFLCQYYWKIQWYIIAAAVGGLSIAGMVYNTLCTLQTKVRHTSQEEGLEIVEGAFGTKTKYVPYSRLISYSIRPSKLNDKLGCRLVVLQAYVGATDKEETLLCLSCRDADILLQDITDHIQQIPRT